MENLKIIGTSHIARQSIHDITKAFSDYNPDMVCVELDHKRLHSLTSDEKPNYSLSGIKRYGLQGYLFLVIAGLLQRKLGNIVGVKPGSDMLTAVNLAKINRKQLCLIDQDIEITLRNFSKRFTFKEKMKVLWDILRSPFGKKVKVNLHKVPPQKLIFEMMEQLKDRYPALYSVLIDDRNKIMAKNLYHIISKNPEKKVLVIIGAGHELELERLIKQEFYKRDKIY